MLEPAVVFVLGGAFAALSSIGRLLVSNKEITRRDALGYVVFYACGGAIVAMGAFEVWPDNPWRLIACAGTVGLAGWRPAELAKWLRGAMVKLLTKTGNGHAQGTKRPTTDDEDSNS